MMSTLGARIIRPAAQAARRIGTPSRVRFTTRAAAGNGRNGQVAKVQPSGISRRPRTLSTDLFFPGQVGSIFRDIEDEIARMWGSEGQQQKLSLLGSCDIKETKDAYTFHMDAPGLTKEDINVRITPDGVLIISGERTKEEEAGDDAAGFHRVERSFGKFQRSFALPENIDTGSIRAEVKHGELTVTVPKKEPVKQEHTQIPVVDASHSAKEATSAA